MKVPTWKTIKFGFQKRSPEILFGLGISSGFVAVGCAIFDTVKAVRKLDEKKKEMKEDDISKKEIVKTCWPCYLPTAGAMIFSVTCHVGSNSMHRKRYAAAVTAYSITDTAFRTYKDKAVDILGEKKERKIQEAASAEMVRKEPDDTDILNIGGKGDTLCYDVISGRYFRSDIEFIRQAVNNINRRMRFEDYVSLNDFYEELLLPFIEIGDLLGWHIDDGYLEVDFTSKLTEKGDPCIVLNYMAAPRYNYDFAF